MLEIPKWIISLIQEEGFACPKCDAPFDPNYIDAIGVKGSHQDNERSVIFTGYNCYNCNEDIQLELPYEISIFEFCLSTLEEAENITDSEADEDSPPPQKRNTNKAKAKKKNNNNNNNKSNSGKKGKSSKITRTETKNASNMLENYYWIDFLKKIGAPMWDAYKANNNENND